MSPVHSPGPSLPSLSLRRVLTFRTVSSALLDSQTLERVQLDGFTPNISAWHPSPRQDQCSPFPSKLSRVTPTDAPAQLSADLFSLCDHLMLQTCVL